MPAAPLAASSSATRRAAAGSDPVSSATRVPPSAAAELTGVGQVAEHRLDRASVLRGQHLGRGQQRGLPAHVDDLQHRPQRHDRLARAHLALQQPVHRVRGREFGREHVADRELSGGQRERQLRLEGIGQSPGPARPRGAGTARGGGAALGQRELNAQRLVPLQTLPGGVPLVP